MNTEERFELHKLLDEFKDVFHVEGEPLTFTSIVKHKLRMKEDTSIYVKAYRKAPWQTQEIDEQVRQLLDQNIIRPSISPWGCPVNVIIKELPDGRQKKRMVIDYRQLNDQMVDDKYPIPKISTILDRLGRSQYFSTIDLVSGYHQVEMNEADIEKTAFNTTNGHYEFTRMPFGLKNAPATFQRLMDHILRGLQDDTCIVYLDDIVIYSTSLQEHLTKLRKVLTRVREANLKANLEKSEFLRKEVKYLGHIITDEGVKPNPEKVRTVQEYPLPTTTKEIKAFLGLVGYYRKFIPGLAKITKPLTLCLKKGQKIYT